MNIKTVLLTIGILILTFVVVIGIIFFVSVYNSRHVDYIFVVGIDDAHFEYELKNTKILMTGASYEFKAQKSKEDIFQGLAKAFPVFKESDDRIQVIAQHQIFTIKELGRNHYILYTEVIHYEADNGVVSIPFPTDQLEKKDENRFNSSFSVNCDIDYLKNFYSHYEGVTVEEQNVIMKNAYFSSNTGDGSGNKTITLDIKGKEVFVSISQ